MQERVRLRAAPVVAGLVLLLIAAAVHLKITSRPIEEARKFRRWSRPRLPVHPPDPRLTPDHPQWREAMEAVEDLRVYFSDPARNERPAEYDRALSRLGRVDVGMLHALEMLALDENESPEVRGAIIEIISRHHEEAVRQFLAGLLADPREHEYVRSKTLDPLGAYEGEPTFRVFRELYDLEPDFPHRHRLLRNIAKTRSPNAVSVLLGALEDGNALEVRCAAAQSLEAYLDRPGVRERLFRIARGGDPVPLRRNAIAALASTPGGGVDELLRRLADSPEEPEEIRRTARSWLELRR